MYKVPRPLLLLHSDPIIQARLRQAAGKDFAIRPVHSWEALKEALQTASPTALVLADPYQEQDRRSGPAPELRELLREFPSASVVAVLEVRMDRISDLRTLGQWGVQEVVSRGEDSVFAIRRVLDTVQGRPLQSLLERSLPARTTGRARAILNAAADTAAAGGQSEDLARTLHVSPRTLLRWCESAGLPPPRQVLAWMRILLAAELLDNPGRSIENVALSCGYASDSGLRRVLKDFLETNPKTLRRRGAFETASRAFREALVQARRECRQEEPAALLSA